ncbi:DUF1127 domain-containing protein [Loktanella agnita]|uniref:DUF1127 domain-containing protein n=1 Tax=Loktanella agnita TaxID=287097 RepID=UPI00398859A1
MSHALHPAQIAALNSQTRLPVLAAVAVGFAVAVVKWDTRRKTRLTLAHLTDYQLKDIGLDRLSAHAEASKPFWQG